VVGKETKILFADAQIMLTVLCNNPKLKANGVTGIFPANRVQDDIHVYADESSNRVIHVAHHLR
jgi:5-methyltetrahydrofolate--homocysteine methyltransferase